MSPLLSYKLSLPRTEGQVLRERLLTGLDEALHERPLLWLLGLPGAGKSSLAAQWLRRRADAGERCVWYRLDEDDADMAGLLDSLRRHPGHGAPERLPAWSPDNEQQLRSFARRFFGQWQQAAEAPLNIVLDDAHRLPDAAPLFELIDAAREVAQGGLRVLLLSRRPPALPLSRGVAAGWLTVFDDLRLEPAEALVLAERAAGRALTGEQATALEAAQGWMAHVLALARQPGTAGAAVGEFLCEELLALLPAGERRSLRLAAELPELPRDLRMLGAAQVRWLDELAARRYFVEPLQERGWRLHDILRDGLRERNRSLETPDALAEARRACAQAVRAELPEAAMTLFVAAGDEAAALDLLNDMGQVWLSQGRHRQLLAWLQALPRQGGAEGELWRAEALLPLAPEAARPLFAASRAAALAASDGHRARRACCGEVSSYVVQWGAVQGLAELVDQFELIDATLGPAEGPWHLRCAADALTALMYGRAEDPRLAQYAKATAALLADVPDAASRIAAAAQLLIYRLWWAGDFPGGRALYDAYDAEVERGDREGSLTPLARLVWWSNAAIVDWQCGDPARCYDKVNRGLALAEASGVHLRDFFLLTQGIFCALSQEDLPRAEGYLARLAQTELGHRRLDSMVHQFFRSWYSLARGDAAQARAHAEAAWPMAEAMGSLFHKVIVLSALAPARLRAGDLAGARETYRAQLALAKLSNNPTFAYIAFCAGAEIALAEDDTEALRKQVERMLTVKQLGGFHSDCGWRSAVRAPLLAFALEQGILPQVAQQWIRQKRLAPPPGFRDGPGCEWPVPVRIRALQGLDVALDESSQQDETPGVKPSAKLRELLAVLVVRRQQGATQTELADWLWPDADGDKAAASLKVALHRLRGWLGFEAVLLKNGVIALNPQRVACDLWSRLDHGPSVPSPAEVLLGLNTPPVQQLRMRLQAATPQF